MPERCVRLVLVRHAESTWNAQGRWQGQSGAGLSDRGREQAARTAHHLAERFGDAQLLVRSDSQRVAETAAPLLEILDVPVVVDARLREVDVGSWSGRTREQVERFDPEGWAAHRAGTASSVGGGETLGAVTLRAQDAVRDVVVRVGEGAAIVMTHGWTLRLLVRELLGQTEHLPRADNCSISILDLRGERVERVVYGDCGHLGDTAMARSTSGGTR